MRAIMADNDIQGQMKVLIKILHSKAWVEIWLSLKLSVRTFADFSLSADTSDAELWHLCQSEQIILLTGNRNKESADSLEATIQAQSTASTLPVFTISDPDRVIFSRQYARQVVETFLQYLLDIDKVRGAGRLWLP